LDSALPVIRGVEGEIREALTNLFLNAFDAMPEGGTLTLRTEKAVDAIRLNVTDTGIGMDEETRKMCLEPFYTTKGSRGTGLGLAMVYGVAQRHGAAVEIESTVGRGTTVRLNFPIPQDAIPDSSEPASSQASLPCLRLLVVDDDPVILKSLRDILTEEGHDVVTANGGQQGIQAFLGGQEGENPFQVVITDLGMPYMDGRKVAAAIKKASPGTPVLLLTGWGQRLLAEGEIPPHVDRVLSKPPKPAQLREALAACVPTRSV
jgi:CheY-like chemotaxis protein